MQVACSDVTTLERDIQKSYPHILRRMAFVHQQRLFWLGKFNALRRTGRESQTWRENTAGNRRFNRRLTLLRWQVGEKHRTYIR